MWSQSFAPTSSGPGIADLPCVAVTPISLAYSGSICCTAPMPRVARCHARTKAMKMRTETSPARREREEVMRGPHARVPGALQHGARQHEMMRRGRGTRGSDKCPVASSTCPLDREALHIILRLRRIESLPHHNKALCRGGGSRKTGLLHQLRRVGCEEHLLRHARIV